MLLKYCEDTERGGKMKEGGHIRPYPQKNSILMTMHGNGYGRLILPIGESRSTRGVERLRHMDINNTRVGLNETIPS